MSIDKYTWREIELTLDDDTTFTFPLRLREDEIKVLQNYELTMLAGRKRLSDIDDVSDVITWLHFRRDPEGNWVKDDTIGQGETDADDLYRKCMRIWQAWDRR